MMPTGKYDKDEDDLPDYKDQVRDRGPSIQQALEVAVTATGARAGHLPTTRAAHPISAAPNKETHDGPRFKDQVNEYHSSTGQQQRQQRQQNHQQPCDAAASDTVVVSDVVKVSGFEDVADTTRILLLHVDDEPANGRYHVASFKNMGFNVITTTSTSSALTLLHYGIQPALIVSDMGRYEDSMGTWGYNPNAGLLLIEEVRKMGASMPIIVTTTSDNVERYQAQVQAAGGAAVVSTGPTLYAAVANALHLAEAKYATQEGA